MAEPKTAVEYLQLPYARVLVPAGGGGYSGRILEFPGCIAEGESCGETLDALERVAESWLEVALALGHAIAEPIAAQEYSGKFALRLPRWLHEQLVRIAAINHTTANQFIVAAIGEKVGQHAAIEQMIPPIREIVGESIRQVAESHFARTAIPRAATAHTEVVQQLEYSTAGTATTATPHRSQAPLRAGD